MDSKWEKGLAAFYEDCGRAVEISHKNLRKLMEDNKGTVYGRAHGFGKVKNPEDYQREVPMSDYKDYEEAIERMRDGEENLLTVYPIKHYLLTSGSTGRQKRIPITAESLRRCTGPIHYASYACIPGIEKAKCLHMSVFRMELPVSERDTILSAAYFRQLHDEGGYGLEERYLGGEGLMFTKGARDVTFVKAWIALSSPELTGIQAFFLYDILVFFRYLEENWEELLWCLQKRRIPERLLLSQEVRHQLLRLPALEEGWRGKVERECRKGFHGIGKRLWDRLGFVSGVGGGTFFAQEEALRRYLGAVPLHYFSYAASECMIAVTTGLESTENVLMPRMGYFEFLPYGEQGARPRTIEELETGRQYEMVATNFSGLYRYQLNDVVEVAGFCRESPKLKVCFRKNQAVNIAGEKMDLGTLAAAMEELSGRFGLCIYEYSVMDDKTVLPGCYQCFLEAEGIRGREDVKRLFGIEEAFDGILKARNPDYEDLRGLGMIGPPKVHAVSHGSHGECKRRFGQEQAQNKPLQYLSDSRAIRFMKERIL